MSNIHAQFKRILTGRGHFRGQTDFSWDQSLLGPTPGSAMIHLVYVCESGHI